MSLERSPIRPYAFSGETFLPDWFKNAQKRSLSNTKKEGNYSPPFPATIFDRREYLGEGEEQIVYGFPQDTSFSGLVIKESKQSIPKPAALVARMFVGNGVENILTWPEVAAIKQYDMNAMVTVFGPQVLESKYVHGYASDRSGRVTNYCIQEKVQGADLWTRMKKKEKVLEDPEIRKQLLRITWGTKRIFLDYNATPDINEGRNVIVTDDKKVALSDPSSASFMGDVVTNERSPFPARYYIISRIERELRFVDHLETQLQPTNDEVIQLNEAFHISEKDVADKRDFLRRKKNLPLLKV